MSRFFTQDKSGRSNYTDANRATNELSAWLGVCLCVNLCLFELHADSGAHNSFSINSANNII